MNQKEIVLNELNAMGFEPMELGDIGYVFKYDDNNYLYMPDYEDEHFLRFAIPRLFDVSDENRAEVMEAMHETTLMLKYAKTCIMFEDSVWAIYEHRLTSTEGLSDLFEHMIRALDATVSFFYKKLNGEELPMRSDDSDDYSDEDIEAALQKILDSVEDDEESK